MKKIFLLLSILLASSAYAGEIKFSSGTTHPADETFNGAVNFGSAGVKVTNDGDGAITLLGLGNGSDEDLTLNLDDTANTAVISSSTGLTDFNVSGMGILLDNSKSLRCKDDAGAIRNVLNTDSGGGVNLNGYHTTSMISGVNGATYFDRSGASDGHAISITSGNAVNVLLGDFTVSVPTNGGSAGADNTIKGLPQVALISLGTGTNGAAANETVNLLDDSPTGEWVATANITQTADGTIYRKGTTALKLVVADAAVAGNGTDNTLSGGDQDWSDDESVGFWLYSTVALTAGDLVVEITDSEAGATTVDVPAVAVNVWTWVEVDISGITGTSRDVITNIAIDLSTAGAALGGGSGFTYYVDYAYKWNADDEAALSHDLRNNGVMAVLAVATASGSANTFSTLAEGTDYIPHWQSGNDAIVWVSDQSANSIIIQYAYN